MSTQRLTMRLALVVAAVGAAHAAFAQPEPYISMRRQEYVPLVGIDLFGRTPRLHTSVTGWALTGSNPKSYEVRCANLFTNCDEPILRTKSSADEPYGMGSITHSESAQGWRGRRVELRAEVRVGRVGGWAGLWMCVDGKESRVLAFDNMQNRPLRGTSSYEWVSVVLDVPPEAERVSFGILLHGPGAIFIREVIFQEVDRTTNSTDLMEPLRASTARPTGGATF
jgi:hypothetical protein